MTRLPAATGAEVVRALERAGFARIRQRGSHVFMRHPDGRATVVPVHSGETLGPGLLSRICHDAGIDTPQLIDLLRGKR